MINSIIKPGWFRCLVISAWLGTLATLSAATSSYSFSVNHEVYFPCAWSFQDEKIADAFPSPSDGDQISIWDVAGETFYTSIFDGIDNAWNHNYTLTNGMAFYYNNAGANDRTITVTGTNLTASSVSFNFVSGKKYLIGMAYLFTSSDGFLECVSSEVNTYPYTTYSFHYPAHDGDHIFTWQNPDAPTMGAWRGGIRRATDCAADAGTPFWESDNTSCTWAWATDIPPQAIPGFGFWFYPAGNATWTQSSSGESPCAP